MTLARGWKARRDNAAKNAKQESDRAEIRRIRAQMLDGTFVAPETAKTEAAEAEVPEKAAEATVAPEPAKKGRKEKPAVLLDDQYLVED